MFNTIKVNLNLLINSKPFMKEIINTSHIPIKVKLSIFMISAHHLWKINNNDFSFFSQQQYIKLIIITMNKPMFQKQNQIIYTLLKYTFNLFLCF
jgi:hypothetical protein